MKYPGAELEAAEASNVPLSVKFLFERHLKRPLRFPLNGLF